MDYRIAFLVLLILVLIYFVGLIPALIVGLVVYLAQDKMVTGGCGEPEIVPMP